MLNIVFSHDVAHFMKLLARILCYCQIHFNKKVERFSNKQKCFIMISYNQIVHPAVKAKKKIKVL